MTTLPCIFLSDPLLDPLQYHFMRETKPSHGTSFVRREAPGILSIPSMYPLTSRGTGISVMSMLFWLIMAISVVNIVMNFKWNQKLEKEDILFLRMENILLMKMWL